VRARGKVLLAAGAGYFSGCVLLGVGTPAGGPGLRVAALACMVVGYGVAAVSLLRPKRKRLRGLELAFLLGFGVLFRLVFLAGGSADVGALLDLPAQPRSTVAAPAPTAPVPQPPLFLLLSGLFSAISPDLWIGRLLLMFFEVGAWGVLLAMLEEDRRPSAWLLLYLWHPVAVVASGAGALSTGTVFFLVLGLWFCRRGLGARGPVALGLSAAGSYLVFPALLAAAAGPLRKRLVGAAVVVALLAIGVTVAWLAPGWRAGFWEALSTGTRNAGLFALVEWATGSRWLAWGVAVVLCAGVGWFFGGREPNVVFDRMLKTAILVAPVVAAGGLHVLIPLLVLGPSVVWAAFPCAVLLLEVALGGGDVPLWWLAAQYGALAAGLVVEGVWRRRVRAEPGRC